MWPDGLLAYHCPFSLAPSIALTFPCSRSLFVKWLNRLSEPDQEVGTHLYARCGACLYKSTRVFLPLIPPLPPASSIVRGYIFTINQVVLSGYTTAAAVLGSSSTKLLSCPGWFYFYWFYFLLACLVLFCFIVNYLCPHGWARVIACPCVVLVNCDLCTDPADLLSFQRKLYRIPLFDEGPQLIF